MLCSAGPRRCRMALVQQRCLWQRTSIPWWWAPAWSAWPVPARWRAAGVDVVGLEIDHDCATAVLADYARWLAANRPPAPLAWSITALPTWAGAPALPAVAAALGGFGLTRLLSYQVAEHLRSGRLQAVLSDFEPPALPVHVLHREGQHASQRVRAFLDLAVERLRADPALN